jgi:hypothetical protein
MDSSNPPTTDFDYKDLQARLDAAGNGAPLYRAIVDTPFSARLPAALLFLGIVVFLLVNKKTGTIDRVALSETELAKNTTDVSVKDFKDIRIPVGHSENIIAQAIEHGQPYSTNDWYTLFAPELTAEEARFNQAGGGIAYSVVHPLPDFTGGGALIFSYFQYPDKIGDAQKVFMERYCSLVAERLKRGV